MNYLLLEFSLFFRQQLATDQQMPRKASPWVGGGAGAVAALNVSVREWHSQNCDKQVNSTPSPVSTLHSAGASG